MSDHEWFEQLSALAVTGDLEPEEFRLLGEHLYECARCRTSYQDFHAIIERGLPTLQISSLPGWSLRGLGMKKRFLERARKEGILIAPSAVRNQSRLRLLAAAVVTCLVVLVGYGGHAHQQDRDRYIARQISANFTERTGEGGESAKGSTENPDAYREYLVGRPFWSQRSPAALEQGLQHFKRAIALDPMYALAHSGLADSYVGFATYGARSAKESYLQAR